MNSYWITFRVDDAKRRRRLLADLEKISSAGSWWNETGSFVMFESSLAIEAIRDRVRAAIDPDQDFAIIGMLYFLKWEIVGTARDKNLFRSLRYLGVF